MNRLGIVVIGRNESAKLGGCLSSVAGPARTIVYVDSGSTDGSSDIARAMGADVVNLDGSIPFSVARARNAGLERLGVLEPSAEFVQFVDADSEIASSWCACGSAALASDSDLAIVFGRIRERTPGKSLFNRLYQVEFDTHFAQSDVCGGMGMMRLAVVRQHGGFNTALHGFEDFDLSRRLRSAGWCVERLDSDMAVHDAAMSSVTQWCRRQFRSGYALGQERANNATPWRAGVRARWSAYGWGLLLPVAAFLGALPTRGASVLLLLAYPAQMVRVGWRLSRLTPEWPNAALYAAACVLGKFPEAAGLVRFTMNRRGQR